MSDDEPERELYLLSFDGQVDGPELERLTDEIGSAFRRAGFETGEIVLVTERVEAIGKDELLAMVDGDRDE